MLTYKNKLENVSQSFVALLFFISYLILTTFHSIAFADIKDQTAEEYRVKGYEEHQKGNFNDALNYYSKAISLGLENSVVLNDMGILYEQLGLPKKAEQYYLQAIQANKFYKPSFINLAYLYKRNGLEEEAFKYFKRRYELAKPGDPWGDKAKEELLSIKPEYKPWVISFEAKWLNDVVVNKVQQEFSELIMQSSEHYKKGMMYLKEKNYERAIDEFDYALKITPRNPKVLDARQEAMIEMVKRDIKHHSEKAVRMLDYGDAMSAKDEIRKILTAIPNEPILNSK